MLRAGHPAGGQFMAPMNWDQSDDGAERLALSVGVSGALVTRARAPVLEQGRLGN